MFLEAKGKPEYVRALSSLNDFIASYHTPSICSTQPIDALFQLFEHAYVKYPPKFLLRALICAVTDPNNYATPKADELFRSTDIHYLEDVGQIQLQSLSSCIDKGAVDILEHLSISLFDSLNRFSSRLFELFRRETIFLCLKTISSFAQTTKMAPYINADVLKTILVFLSMTSDGATEVARAMLTSDIFKTVAKDVDVLKAMNWSNVRVEGRSHLFHHINGLLSQSAELGNETAQYVLSKVVLLGSTPMWSRMLKNDRMQAYTNNKTDHSPEAKKSVIDFLRDEAIAEMPCISNVFYGNRHHTRLVRLFISRCSSEDITQMCQYLERYAQFFKGFAAVVRSGFFSSITKMCNHGYEMNQEDPNRYITEDIMGESGSDEPYSISLWVLLSPEKVFDMRREQALSDFNQLFPLPPAPDHQPQ